MPDSGVLSNSDSEAQSVMEKQERPQSCEFSSFKGRAAVDSSGNKDPQALNCNLATQGFLCVSVPHPARQVAQGAVVILSPGGRFGVHSGVTIIPPTLVAVRTDLTHTFRMITPRFCRAARALRNYLLEVFIKILRGSGIPHKLPR